MHMYVGVRCVVYTSYMRACINMLRVRVIPLLHFGGSSSEWVDHKALFIRCACIPCICTQVRSYLVL